MAVDLNRDEESLKHRTGELKLKAVHLGITIEFPVYVFIQPRPCNQRVFWTYSQVYKLCQHTGYQGQASKWVFDQASSAWLKTFVDAVGSDQTVFGANETVKS